MKNRDYWGKRFILLKEILLDKSDKYKIQLNKEYEKAIKEAEDSIYLFYQRFSVNNNITFNDAKKILNSKERERFQLTLEDYIKKGKENGISDKWTKELENASTVHRISRLKALQIQMQQQIELLSFSKNKNMSDLLKNIYEDSYYGGIYEIQKGLGYGRPFTLLDTKKINIAALGAYNNESFSDNIWHDKQSLLQYLNTDFVRSIIRGSNPQTLSNEMAKKFNTSKNNATRLLMTESANVSSLGTRKCFEELGVEEYENIETLDSNTCPVCQDMDGTHFKLKDFQVGATAAPFHPNCRGAQAPFFNDEFTEKELRAARDENDNVYYVPSDMSYKEWKEKYVKNPTNKPDFIKIRNAEDVPSDVLDRLNKELSLIPNEHRGIIKSSVKELVFIKEGNSHYDRREGENILYLLEDFIEGEAIHELGHAIETALDLYHDEEFLEVLSSGLEDIRPFDIIYDDTFPIPIYRVENPKFISDYQGCIYECDIDYNGRLRDDKTFNVKCFAEYFSEGYREYVYNLKNLEKRDNKLVNFIIRRIK